MNVKLIVIMLLSRHIRFQASDLLLDISINGNNKTSEQMKLQGLLLELNSLLISILKHVRTLYEKSHRRAYVTLSCNFDSVNFA